MQARKGELGLPGPGYTRQTWMRPCHWEAFSIKPVVTADRGILDKYEALSFTFFSPSVWIPWVLGAGWQQRRNNPRLLKSGTRGLHDLGSHQAL